MLLFAAAACTGAASAPDTLRGTFRHGCAPYDGPAFSVTLPHRASRSDFWLRANVPLSQARGTWQHVLQSGPGQATIVRCQTSGERACTSPESGSFRIEMPAQAAMRGTLDVTFPGRARERFSFEAKQQELKQQWFCG